jgi:anaerobic selenocysteine-containing dehydrogenase
MNPIQTHYRTCSLCEAMCGIKIQYKNNDIISITGDKNDVFSQGHICPKAVALKDLYYDKDRLKTPLKKTKNGWINISWNEALDEVANKIKAIQDKYGDNAVATYQGNPNVHNVGLMLYGKPLIKSLKTRQKYTASSVDQLPHHIASLLMFGHQMMIPIPDLDRTDYMLILGANPAISNGSMLTAPDFKKRLKAIKNRNGKVVCIDPRFTETAKVATEHHFIHPGKDALFLLSIIHVIFKEHLSQKGHLEKDLKNWTIIKDLSTDFPPETTEKFIGISALKMRETASEFAKAKTAVCYGRLGVSTQEFGGMCIWLVNVLNLITDNTDKIGGAMFTLPAIDLVGMSGSQNKTGTFNRYQSRVNNLPEYSGEFPVATLADEILTKGEEQVKAFVCIAGNPVLSTPNGAKLEKALSELDFMVSLDIYLNETSKYADIILPTTTGLETIHYDLAFHQLAVKNTSKFCEPLFEKEANQRHDWQVLNALTERLTGEKNPATPEMMLDFMLKYSPYKSQNITIKTLKEQPHGVDFGDLKPCLSQRLFSEDKKIDLAPMPFVNDIKRLKSQMKQWQTTNKTDYPFYLIGRRQLRNNNSWMHNSAILTSGKNRCTLLIHPMDAEKLHLKNGQDVLVTSNVNTVKIPVEISQDMMQGVLSIPHGFGHHRNGIKMHIAEKNAGVSINDLTDDQSLDNVTGNANFSGTKVKIETVLG